MHKLGADIVVSDGQGLREMQVLCSVKKECTLRMNSMDRRFAHAILITNELPEQVACRTEMKITNRMTCIGRTTVAAGKICLPKERNL